MIPFFTLAINKTKDGYVWLIDAIDAHPHITLWSGLALIVLALVV